MPRPQRRSFTQPEETRTFPHGNLRIINLDEVVVGRYQLEPGWRWSNEEGNETYLGIEFSGSRTFAVPPEAMGGGIVATLLFTDIVGSTATLARVGDAAWREMLLAHNVAMRAEIERFRGRELKTTGDGFLAAFDSASRAVRCGQAMIGACRAHGLEVRVGCHTGEVEIVQGDAHGVAVHAAARVMAIADAGQVFVSWTTRDLLAGSSISVESVGSHELKGLDKPREVFRVL